MAPTPPHKTNAQAYHIAQQQTTPQPTVLNPSVSPTTSDAPPIPITKRIPLRIVAVILAVALTIALYFIWRSPTSATSPAGITQQNFSASTPTANSPTDSSGDIQVYIVGAVKHPGVYTLPAGARVYQLLQAAGGPLPNANLVALNMAAKLSDGQEVYVTVIGETPPTYVGGVPGPGSGPSSTGQPVNINTATVDEMQQSLHISRATAQKIVDYRLQHGNYTSIDQLLQVVSKAVYNKIKDLVTV